MVLVVAGLQAAFSGYLTRTVTPLTVYRFLPTTTRCPNVCSTVSTRRRASPSTSITTSTPAGRTLTLTTCCRSTRSACVTSRSIRSLDRARTLRPFLPLQAVQVTTNGFFIESSIVMTWPLPTWTKWKFVLTPSSKTTARSKMHKPVFICNLIHRTVAKTTSCGAKAQQTPSSCCASRHRAVSRNWPKM